MQPLVPAVVPGGVLGVGEQPTLHHADLTLQPWGLQHVDGLLAAYRESSIQRWNVQTMDRADAEAYPARWANLWREGRRVGWAVERDGRLAGRVALNGLDTENGQAAVAYWVLPEARGTGVAARAVQTVTAWAFALGFHRLELLHSIGNPASCRVSEKAGFRLEGTKRSQGLHEDGWHDMHLHARLAGDTRTV